MRGNADQNNSEYGHFSRNVRLSFVSTGADHRSHKPTSYSVAQIIEENDSMKNFFTTPGLPLEDKNSFYS